MDALKFRGVRKTAKHRLGFVVLPTCLAVVGIEVIAAAAFVLPSVAEQRTKQREELAAAVDRLGGIAPNYYFPDDDVWWERAATSVVVSFSHLDGVIFGRVDTDLECVKPYTKHLEKIDDAELQRLAKFPAMAYVESLGLAGTAVTDASVECLTGFSKLRYLDIGFTKISAEGITRLRRALPRCDITYLPRKQAVHDRNFEPQDYQTFETMLDTSMAFMASATILDDESGVVFNFDGTVSNSLADFSARLADLNGRLRDVDLDVLSECLKAQILFYRQWGDAAAIVATPPMLSKILPTDSFAEVRIEMFRQQFEMAWKKHYSTAPGRYSRIGVSFDFDVKDSDSQWPAIADWCSDIGRVFSCSSLCR